MSHDPTIELLRRAFQHEQAPDDFEAIYQRAVRARRRSSQIVAASESLATGSTRALPHRDNTPVAAALPHLEATGTLERGVVPGTVSVRARWPRGTFLGALRPSERDAVLAVGHRRAFGTGTALVREGEPATHAVVLLAGRVRATMTNPDGRVTLLDTHGAGDIAGEVGVLDTSTHSATVTAVGKVVAVVIPAASFALLLRSHPEVSRALLLVLARSVRAAHHRSQLASRDVSARVASALVQLARGEGEPTPEGPLVRMTRSELAQLVGAAEVTVVKTLTRFKQQDLVRRGRGKVTILRPEKLSRVAGLQPWYGLSPTTG